MTDATEGRRSTRVVRMVAAKQDGPSLEGEAVAFLDESVTLKGKAQEASGELGAARKAFVERHSIDKDVVALLCKVHGWTKSGKETRATSFWRDLEKFAKAGGHLTADTKITPTQGSFEDLDKSVA